MSKKIEFRSYKGIDYAWSPESYFNEYNDLKRLMLRNVKGSYRRKAILDALESDEYDELPEMIRAESLSADVVSMISSMHPAFTGGEYLPDYLPFEVEIARIELESTLREVISLRARPCAGRIWYRIVDENGYLTYDLPRETSLKPLTLRKLISLVSGTYVSDTDHYLPWAFSRCNIDCMDADDEGSSVPSDYRHFTGISSDFYAQLDTHYMLELEENFPLWEKAYYRWVEQYRNKLAGK